MRYYVVSDVHGFYDELMMSLEAKGFFDDEKDRKLIVCGDLFDRGDKAKELQSFITDLLEKGEVILIKGNHEDLMLDLIKGWDNYSYTRSHHHSNGTVDTIYQLTDTKRFDLLVDPDLVKRILVDTPYIKDIIPKMLDFYETEHYIFVHGYIPTILEKENGYTIHHYDPDWRNATKKEWDEARWTNGIKVANDKVIEKGKTIVCGHWHASFGHALYEGKGQEFGEGADFSPYYGEGIIAIDACTAYSKKVNCLVIEE